jgi:hypothetical protein
MEKSKLVGLLTKIQKFNVDSSNNGGIVSLNPMIAGKLYGGYMVYNPSCTNSNCGVECKDDSNGSCTNNTCSSQLSNNSCTNTVCN